MCFLKGYFTPEDEKFAITGGNVVNSQDSSFHKESCRRNFTSEDHIGLWEFHLIAK